MAEYSIDVRPRARRSLRQLDPSVRKAIAQLIEGLAANPRGSAALTLRQIPAVTLRTAGILTARVLSGGTARRSRTW